MLSAGKSCFVKACVTFLPTNSAASLTMLQLPRLSCGTSAPHTATIQHLPISYSYLRTHVTELQVVWIYDSHLTKMS